MAIRSLPISLASSPNSRGRDPQGLDEDEPAGTNAPEGTMRQFKPRSATARASTGQLFDDIGVD
jgi:hypothetical protein